jgi:hypothetical protein
VLIPHPDSIAVAAVNLVEKSKANVEMFQYVLSFLINKFQTSERMGMDGVFVALAEKYYLGGQAWWADQKLLDKIAERVNALKPNLIGKVAPDLWLPDPNGKYFRLRILILRLPSFSFGILSAAIVKRRCPSSKAFTTSIKSMALRCMPFIPRATSPSGWRAFPRTS